jgi:hypothetical protein
VHYFSCSGGSSAIFIKSTMGHVTVNLCFCIRWDMWDTYCIPVHLGHKTSMHYFSCLGGAGIDSTKSVGTRYIKLVFLHPV